MKTKNTITTNSDDLLLLIVNDPQNVSVNEIEENSIDAVLLDLKGEMRNSIFKFLSKIRTHSEKDTYLVPVFLLNAPEGVPEKYLELCDGDVHSAEDPKILNTGKRIHALCKELPVLKLPPYSTRVLTKALRFMYTRKSVLKPVIDVGSPTGYIYPFINIHSSKEQGEQETLPLLNDALNEGYFKSAFVDRVHLCPDCLSVYHNFREMCPKCKSPQLSAENIIHHFVCAYVGPESDFMVDNNMICPKCKKLLRHIGVDYDKPSLAYECQDCKHFFQEPEMESYCFNCKSHNPVDNLIPYDIQSFKLTDLGNEIAKTGISAPSLKDEIFFPGFIPYKIFSTYLQFEIDRTQRFSSCTIVGSIGLKFMNQNVLGKQLLNKILYDISDIILKSSVPSTIFSFKNNTFLLIVPDEFDFKVTKQLEESQQTITKLIETTTGGSGDVSTFYKVHEIEAEDTQQSIINDILSSES